jgi:hypothetical protein
MPRAHTAGLRLGRHQRRAALLVAAAAFLAVPPMLALFRFGPAWAQMLGVAVSLAGLLAALVHLRAARRADAAEERWLRGVLDGLGDDAIDDGDRLDFKRP